MPYPGMVEPNGFRGSGPKRAPSEADAQSEAEPDAQPTAEAGDTTALAIPTASPAASPWTVLPPATTEGVEAQRVLRQTANGG
eukprot:12889846-Prorocentrum_lima.AAC.1